jgi:O-methyltransferase
MTDPFNYRRSLTYRVKQIAKSMATASGFEVRRKKELPRRADDIRHAEIFPAATYSPWLSDGEFQRVFNAVQTRTLVDCYRCYELWQLVAEAAKLQEGDLLEVGVWRGGTGALIASKCQFLGVQNTVYLCDTFRGVVKTGEQDPAYRDGEHADTTKEAVLELCNHLALDRVQVLEGIFPDDSGMLLSERHFRFCHVDVDVYASARDIANWIWPRLVPGGIIVYDDYGFHNCSGITQFVNEERRKLDRIVIHNLNGHGVVIKLPSGSI